MTDSEQKDETAGVACFDEEELGAGKHLFHQPCGFLKGVVDVAGLPEMTMGEVAFAGRSNVGKSSLINAVVRQKSMARTSNTPGRTREVNFFTIGEALYLVDMPGYGYAKASKSEIRSWNKLILDYLKGRASLSRVFLLVDSRHGVKKNDEEIMAILDEAAVSYQVVLTKIDKLKKGEKEKVVQSVLSALARRPAAFPEIIATSSNSGEGIVELRASVAVSIGYKVS